MAEEIKTLEDHTHFLPDRVDILCRIIEGMTIDDNGTGADRLQPVDGAQQGGFPGTGRPDNHHLFPRLHRQGDIGQRLKGAEKGIDMLYVNDWFNDVHND